MEEKIRCQKCGKLMAPLQFYTLKTGEKTDLCKECLTMHVDNWDENTYLWILEKIDVPYLPSEWANLRDRAFAKDPKKMNGMSVLGKYLSKMRIKPFNQYGWADTEKLQQEKSEKAMQNAEELGKQLQELKEQGVINEAQYRTYAPTIVQRDESVPDEAATIGSGNLYNEGDFMREEELPDPAAQLTQDDKIYLAVKWGRLYKPNEWIALEQDYKKMEESFSVEDPDSQNALILLCKTNLKANQALDEGDLDGFQKLSKVSDSLRKSAKFTAAQNKKDKGDSIDCIGKLITMCEEEGFIPRFCTDLPQDKVDATLRDQQMYVRKLVTEDLGFGQQIETALKRIEIQRQMEAEHADDILDDEPHELTDEEIYEDIENVQQQIEQDKQMQEGE